MAEFFAQLTMLTWTSRQGIVSICVDMLQEESLLTHHSDTIQELKRYYYVTPTSYLILIKTFKEFVGCEKRKYVTSVIFKVREGYRLVDPAASERNVTRLSGRTRTE